MTATMRAMCAAALLHAWPSAQSVTVGGETGWQSKRDTNRRGLDLFVTDEEAAWTMCSFASPDQVCDTEPSK